MKDIAETAVLDLQEGIDHKDRDKILAAYGLVEAESFDWDEVPDYVFEEWEKLVDIANDLIQN